MSALLRMTTFAVALAVLPACQKNIPAVDLVDEEIRWPPPPEPAVITWTGHIANSSWAAPPTAFQNWIARISGEPPGVTFRKPYAVTSDDEGRVYVSDTGWGLVLMFDKDGRSFEFVGGSGQGALQKPAGMVVDSRGHLFVADLKLGRVIEFDDKYEFVQAFGGGVLTRPVAVIVDEAAGQVWISDSKNHTVEIFDLNAQHVRTVGERGSNEGQFNFPTNMVINDETGEVFVVDTFNFRVQVFDREGEFVRKWGRNCDSFGCFARAKGIGMDGDGNLYIADAAFNNVQVFDPDGNLLMFFGGIGNGPGQLWLPAGLHVSNQGEIYVVSQYNWRVNTYRYLGAPGSEQAAR